MGKILSKTKRLISYVFGVPLMLLVIAFFILAFVNYSFPFLTQNTTVIAYILLGVAVAGLFIGIRWAYGERNLEEKESVRHDQELLILDFLQANQDKENNTKSVILQHTIEKMIPAFENRVKAQDNFMDAFAKLLNRREIRKKLTEYQGEAVYCLGQAPEQAKCFICGRVFNYPDTGGWFEISSTSFGVAHQWMWNGQGYSTIIPQRGKELVLQAGLSLGDYAWFCSKECLEAIGTDELIMKRKK